ncbi:MAG: DUF3037 domain-containing protein [Janthinobacterium lividum]
MLSFDYAVLRVVPRVEREEFLNAGVVLFCLQRRYLRCAVHLDADRLRSLWPGADAAVAANHLRAVERICVGEVAAGPIAKLSQRERFHWMTAPRSTVLQSSPVRTGVCTEDTDLDRRLSQLVSDLLLVPAKI